MRGADTLIPARFLTLTSHLSAVVTLLWESHKSTRNCLPIQHHDDYFQIYHSRLVAGFASSLALILLEFFTFLSGLTMFSSTACLVSVAGHGCASIALTYFVVEGWLCDWYWWVFVLCSVVPCCVDVYSAFINMCSLKW